MVTQKFERSELHQGNSLTIQEVADWANVSTKTVYRWISDSRIAAIRIGNRTYRVSEKAIIDYLSKAQKIKFSREGGLRILLTLWSKLGINDQSLLGFANHRLGSLRQARPRKPFQGTEFAD